MTASANDLNVSELIDRSRMSGFQVGVVVLGALVILLDGFDTQSISLVASLLAPNLAVKVTDFGPVFGVGLFGLTVGALMAGPFADRFGRRLVIILSVLEFGLFSLLTVRIETFHELMVVRFFTGLGLGAAMPNMAALTSEYAPARLRATLVGGIFAAFPLGGVIGGTISAKIVTVWGWQSIFYGAGILPIVCAIVLALFLPESIRFLVNKGGSENQIAGILERVNASFQWSGHERFVTGETKLEGMPVGRLFTDGRAGMTLLLWVPFFMNLLMLFFMFSWLPPLMQKAGLPISESIFAAVIFNVGAIAGGLVQGPLIDRLGYFRVLGLAYLAAAVCVGLVGDIAVPSKQLLLVIFLAGVCIVGGQNGVIALATNIYPTSIRATGVGWAFGVGRIGSIVGPVVGGILLSLNWESSNLFVMAAVPGVFSTASIVLLSRLARKRKLLPPQPARS